MPDGRPANKRDGADAKDARLIAEPLCRAISAPVGAESRRSEPRFIGGIVRHYRIANILLVIPFVACFAVAQVPRQRGGGPSGVPAEFQFLYQGSIPSGQLKAVSL